MSKILLINPSKWGRGITPIWIASHSGILKLNGHDVELFDATFYKNWTNNEVKFNTDNKQYKPSDYLKKIKLKEESVEKDLSNYIKKFGFELVEKQVFGNSYDELIQKKSQNYQVIKDDGAYLKAIFRKK